MSGRFRKLALCLGLAALSGCVSLPPRGKTVATDAGLVAAQAAREEALRQVHDWRLDGRLGISNASDSRGNGSGSLSWQQRGDSYVFTVNGGFGYDYRLSGDSRGAVLEGVGKQPIRGADAEALMRKAAGWSVPLASLRAWVLGLRATGAPAQITFGTDRLPAVLEQDGWRVEYRAWDNTRQPALPTKVFASKPPYKVRLSVSDWTLR
ncbi:lipoprotein insertase outer membrane protein LolB [Dyella sp.]|jgi:outer membrane lipoprotein LolB|uniref:lipoprotein insertase outer membrane protein LolB n=1 Tax=Dyella sp. TaxID=1869338 RepID=UPI002D79417A|nr:lipoprotein insertase outer membrane protein LolB [Dyella sp.]HET6431058.1 lipoprotein insertase outer membrane protein LolB [Dyella sp.]